MSKIIAVFATVPGAGATFVATNIAAWFALHNVKTLLIDVSTRGVLGPLFLNEVAREAVFPTISTWREFHDKTLLTTGYGLAVLPNSQNEIEKQEKNDTQIEDLLNHYSFHDLIIIDAGGDIILPQVDSVLDVADATLMIAEPTQRCLQAIPEQKKQKLIEKKNVQLVVNKISKHASYYHPRDIARWFDLEGFFEIQDDPQLVIDSTKKRLPLVMYGKGKACISLQNVARDMYNNLIKSNSIKTIVSERKIKRERTGKPSAILGIGDARIEEWIRNNFSEQMNIVFISSQPEEIKTKLTEQVIDILILMRQGSIGGIPSADELAVWASEFVPTVLFIVGELDDEGKKMVIRSKDAGINHIITCEKGGQIYGDELVYVLTTIIRQMQEDIQTGQDEAAGSKDTITKKTVSTVIKGASTFREALRQSAETATEKTKATVSKRKLIPKINMSKGLSIDEEAKPDVVINNLKNPTAIVSGGVFAVVSPWRPNLAGRLAAQAVKILSEVEGSEVAYVGASEKSTGALWLDVPDEVLMMSDWRLPGASYPVVQGNLKIYAVDPTKDLSPDCEADLWALLKEARKTSNYTVMDFAGDFAMAQKAAHQGRSVLLAVVPGNDPVEYKISSLWLRNIMDGKENIVTGIDLRGMPPTIPEGIKPRVVIRNNPADALVTALKKVNEEEFHWI